MQVDGQKYFISFEGKATSDVSIYGCTTVGQMSMLEIDIVSTTLPNTQALLIFSPNEDCSGGNEDAEAQI